MQFNASEHSEEYNPMVNDDIKLTKQEKESRIDLAYEWRAIYDDGTSLDQYDDDKQLVRHFGHINQDIISEFEILPTREGILPIKVSLKTGLFYFNNKPVLEISQGNARINLGLSLSNKQVTSSWGNKAKLIYVRHIVRNFIPSPYGFSTDVHIRYELGWEADVDGVHRKHSIIVNEFGVIEIPGTFEDDGFNPL